MKHAIRIVDNRKILNDFIKLPAHIHAHHDNWLPPLYNDEKMFFNPEKNKAFKHCETIMAVAYLG